MKWKRIFFILILLIIPILIVAGSSINYRGDKYCMVDSDCLSKSGCNHGCWSKFPLDNFFRTCTFTAGPEFCLCQEKKCSDASTITDILNKERLIKTCEDEDFCEDRINFWLSQHNNSVGD